MMQFGLIGLGAGAAAALLFASVTSGAWLSLILFYLAPLPIMIAGLGWSHWSALIASVVAALALGGVFGGVFFFAFLAGAGLPAWWLSYLTMLARPGLAAAGAAPGQNNAPLEWYPPGRLVIWAAILGALVVVVAIPNFGLDAESFRASLNGALARMLQIETGASPDQPLSLPGASDPKRLLALLVDVIPPAAAVLATLTNLVNLWLGARVVNFSGRLKRPWPVISAMTFPPLAAAVLAGAVALSFAGGLIGIVAGVLTSSMLMAYGVLGFAVMHDITRGTNSRPFLLGGLYASVLVFGWPMLALCILGLIETATGLRARVRLRRGPPPAKT
jgi:hypothetical protein